MPGNKNAAVSAPPPTTATVDNGLNASSPHTLYNNIPEELKQYPNWVVRKDKIPYNPLTNKSAKSNDPNTWVDFDTAIKHSGRYSGIGFMFGNSPFVGVDLDHHLDKETGEPDEFAQWILDKLQSYSEISPSGDGCHIIVRASIPEALKNSDIGLEIYPDGRYFTMTGLALPRYGNMIQERTAEVLELIQAYSKKPQEQAAPLPPNTTSPAPREIPLDDDTRLIEVMRRSDNTGKFKALFDMGDLSHYYNDHSKADAALLQTLAYYTNCDPVRMERLFSASALGQREKWQTRKDYRDRTIKGAISVCIQHSPEVFGKSKVLIDTNQFFEGKDFLHEEFAKYLIKTYHIIKIYDEGLEDAGYSNPIMYYKHNKGIYIHCEPILNQIMLSILEKLKNNQRREVESYIRNMSPLKPRTIGNLINCSNGVLNLLTGELVPHSPSFIFTARIPVIYNPTIVTNETLRNFMYTLFGDDSEMHAFIFEVFGYLLSSTNFMQKFFLFTGEGGNGKSTMLSLMELFIGYENTSRISLANIDARFMSAELADKMLNIGDDIGAGGITETAELKKIVSGDPITAERKNQQPFIYRPRTKLVYSCNKMPAIYDRSLGMYDRMTIVPFNMRIRDTAIADPYMGEKLSHPDVLSCLLNGALWGLQRLWQNKKFTTPQAIATMKEQYIKDNDPVAQFIEAADGGEITYYSGIGETTLRIDRSTEATTVYYQYKAWAERSGYKPVADNSFGREMQRLGYEKVRTRVGSKRIYVFEKSEDVPGVS